MAAPYTTRVRGLREFYIGCGRVSKKIRRELQVELRALAEPAARTARELASAEGWGPTTAEGIRAGSRLGGANYGQRNRRTTGHRAKFGSVQMRKALLPAAVKHEDEIVEGVEDMLDRLTSAEGFGRGGIL